MGPNNVHKLVVIKMVLLGLITFTKVYRDGDYARLVAFKQIH